MVQIGDMVAVAGRSLRMLVVELPDARGFVLCAFKARGRELERAIHASRLVLIRPARGPGMRARR